MKRYIQDRIQNDLSKKIVFITGPRQVGKTYLSKNLLPKFKSSLYLNNDDIDDIKIIKKRAWPLNTELIVFDELHKMKNWKNYLKGTYDTHHDNQKFLVTGSARLDIFRQTGDSLAGRYFLYHLNPLSVKELEGIMPPYEALSLLIRLGGFPEPFLSGSDDEANRWRRQYFTDIIREDILDFSRVNEIRIIRTLIEMLRKRVGAPLSYTSISEDLQVSPNTIKRYVEILEALHIIFLIRPYHKNIARSILREPKVYFYDTGYVDADEGIKLENTIAISLLKNIQFIQDTKGSDISLNYLKTKDSREVDFAVSEGNKLLYIIEVKLSDFQISKNLMYFKQKFIDVNAIQLVHNLRNERQENGILVSQAGKWLSGLEA